MNDISEKLLEIERQLTTKYAWRSGAFKGQILSLSFMDIPGVQINDREAFAKFLYAKVSAIEDENEKSA